jgi:hypothetical protein
MHSVSEMLKMGGKKTCILELLKYSQTYIFYNRIQALCRMGLIDVSTFSSLYPWASASFSQTHCSFTSSLTPSPSTHKSMLAPFTQNVNRHGSPSGSTPCFVLSSAWPLPCSFRAYSWVFGGLLLLFWSFFFFQYILNLLGEDEIII